MATGISSPLALSGLYPSVDGSYVAANGKPFTSVSNAESALNGFPSKLSELCVGLTVLVKESGWTEAKEYWVQPKGTTPETYGLVEKGTTDYNDLDNKPTIGDGTNTALPIVGNVKVTASTALGETAGVTVTPGQTTGEIEMQFTLPKGADGADGQDGQDGADGADAVNPFKGYYPTGVSKPATGAVGDYLYAPQSDSQSTATATIWHYDNAKTPSPWTDTGIDVSAVVGVEFGSGQPVTATKIRDKNGEEVQGTADVLSAAAGAELNRISNSLTDALSVEEQETERDITPNNPESGYINSNGGVSTSSYAHYTDFISIEENTSYKYVGAAASAYYVAYYSSASESSFISAQQYPAQTSGTTIEFEIPQNAMYFRATLGYSVDAGAAKLYKTSVEKVLVDDLPERVAALEESVNSMGDVVDALSEEQTVVLTPSLSEGGKYLESDGSEGTSAYTTTKYTDYVEILNGADYLLKTKGAHSWCICYYTGTKVFISSQPLVSSPSALADNLLVVPEGAIYFRASLNATDAVLYETKKVLVDDLPERVSSLENSSTDMVVGTSEKVGFLKNLGLFEKDLLYVPVYGQSYTGANDGGYKLTTVFDSNTYMHGTSPIGVGDRVLRPLSTTANAEYIPSDFADIFARLIKAYAFRAQDILVGSYGQGSRSVMELQKDNGYGSNFHTYEDKFEPGVANAVLAATNANKTIGCPFILYMQGESDIVSTRPNPATSDSWCKGDKDLYKQELSVLIGQMQTTIKAATGQVENPLVIVYCPGNTNFNSTFSGIQQGILELCEERDDVFCVGSYYWMASMGAHPSPDGRRWLAELFAKSVFELFVRGEDNTMKIGGVDVQGDIIKLYLKTPYAPIVFDTWTTPAVADYGFAVYNTSNGVSNAVRMPIDWVKSVGDCVVLQVSGLKDVTDAMLVYGGASANGGGNVRESGVWRTYYDYASNDDGTGHLVYAPKDEAGDVIIGKRYPMQAWLPQFGIVIKG